MRCVFPGRHTREPRRSAGAPVLREPTTPTPGPQVPKGPPVVTPGQRTEQDRTDEPNQWITLAMVLCGTSTSRPRPGPGRAYPNLTPRRGHRAGRHERKDELAECSGNPADRGTDPRTSATPWRRWGGQPGNAGRWRRPTGRSLPPPAEDRKSPAGLTATGPTRRIARESEPLNALTDKRVGAVEAKRDA